MIDFGIKDIIDILIVALLLFYLYRLMRNSGTLSLFYGVLAFIAIWVVAYEIFDMRLTGTIVDKFMSIGLIVLAILFQDQIKRFLIDIGGPGKLSRVKRIFRHDKNDEREHTLIMNVVYACMSMSKSKTGALIVIEQDVPLENYEKTGDMINAEINTRLIENIFFKNSPLHDGAMIISDGHIKAAGCILPVSHDSDVPRSLGLRHRSALGISQATDAFAIVVSEETGNISVAYRGKLTTRLTSTELEKQLSSLKNI